jgi:hypothetical protein
MDEKQILSKNLKKFPIFFGGALGMLNIKPVKLEIMYGAKPYHAKTIPCATVLRREYRKINE